MSRLIGCNARKKMSTELRVLSGGERKTVGSRQNAEGTVLSVKGKERIAISRQLSLLS